ncbi:hypothetical protein TREES_T100011702 [Tupaia chinensis]|uniref:Uncharacterized protein n=1 Tax=Tupaia chinensis TaxID=246437 RepID=L9L0K5_TUPCH|nr:hypothetical protein TREES_T100011702 [Tupaia chinensis]
MFRFTLSTIRDPLYSRKGTLNMNSSMALTLLNAITEISSGHLQKIAEESGEDEKMKKISLGRHVTFVSLSKYHFLLPKSRQDKMKVEVLSRNTIEVNVSDMARTEDIHFMETYFAESLCRANAALDQEDKFCLSRQSGTEKAFTINDVVKSESSQLVQKRLLAMDGSNAVEPEGLSPDRLQSHAGPSLPLPGEQRSRSEIGRLEKTTLLPLFPFSAIISSERNPPGFLHLSSAEGAGHSGVRGCRTALRVAL